MGDEVHVYGGSGGAIACLEDLGVLAQKLDLAAERVARAEALVNGAATELDEARAATSAEVVALWGSPVGGIPEGGFLEAVLTGTKCSGQIAAWQLDVFGRAEAEVEAVRGGAGMGGLSEELQRVAGLVRQAKAFYDEAEETAAHKMSAWAATRARLISANNLLGPIGQAAGIGSTLASMIFGMPGFWFANGRAPSIAEMFRAHQGDVRTLIAGAIPLISFGIPSTSQVLRGVTRLTAPMVTPDGLWINVEQLAPKKGKAPADMAGLVAHVNALAVSRSADAHKISVSKVVAKDGKVSWLVAIPGTMEMNLGDGKTGADMGQNGRAVAGDPNAVSMSVVAALQKSGVKKGEPVVLAGHSQGGIVSAQLAADPDFNRAWTVAGVLTLGSPVGELRPRHGQQWMSLEHSQDIIPALTPPNRRGANHTTVVRDLSSASDPKVRTPGLDPLEGHGLGRYEDTARRVDNSNTGSVRTWRDAVAPVMDQDAEVTTTEYEIRAQNTPPEGGKMSRVARTAPSVGRSRTTRSMWLG
ncbi:MAG: GPI inositol-deacylase [Bifidobacteriaceae bacterium]|jgi:hypothetical protein|nr:GPI inositol-deacylase [Bifidobacteriaceae bacterium]